MLPKRKLSSCCIHLKIFDLALCGRTKDRIFGPSVEVLPIRFSLSPCPFSLRSDQRVPCHYFKQTSCSLGDGWKLESLSQKNNEKYIFKRACILEPNAARTRYIICICIIYIYIDNKPVHLVCEDFQQETVSAKLKGVGAVGGYYFLTYFEEDTKTEPGNCDNVARANTLLYMARCEVS